jgi:glycine/D-amino acid oxidase-like deaminating enzyme
VSGPAGRDGPAGVPRRSPAGPLFDAVVVGLGALGSAAAWVLARSVARVLGLEQFELGHQRGASHDHARIIRRSYHTPGYVRLAGLAYRAWAELEWEAEERLVVTTGGLAQLGVTLPLVVTQEQFSYFRPADPAAFALGRFPVWIWMDDPCFYGFPVWPDAALKAAQDVGGHRVSATTRTFAPDPAASDRLAGFLRARLPAATGAHGHTATCLYTLTPDRDLALGPVGGHDRVLVALGAAHGFKFAPLVGRVLADLALHGGTDVDITPFALDRPALTTPQAEPSYLV